MARKALPIKAHAGIAPYRLRADDTVEVLLITAFNPANSWIFPLGTVEAGELLQQAAARECAEESGYTVEVGPRLTIIDLPKRTSIHRVTFFAGKVTGQIQDYEFGRQHLWVNPADAPHIIADIFQSVANALLLYIKQTSP